MNVNISQLDETVSKHESGIETKGDIIISTKKERASNTFIENNSSNEIRQNLTLRYLLFSLNSNNNKINNPVETKLHEFRKLHEQQEMQKLHELHELRYNNKCSKREKCLFLKSYNTYYDQKIYRKNIQNNNRQNGLYIIKGGQQKGMEEQQKKILQHKRNPVQQKRIELQHKRYQVQLKRNQAQIKNNPCVKNTYHINNSSSIKNNCINYYAQNNCTGNATCKSSFYNNTNNFYFKKYNCKKIKKDITSRNLNDGIYFNASGYKTRQLCEKMYAIKINNLNMIKGMHTMKSTSPIKKGNNISSSAFQSQTYNNASCTTTTTATIVRKNNNMFPQMIKGGNRNSKQPFKVYSNLIDNLSILGRKKTCKMGASKKNSYQSDRRHINSNINIISENSNNSSNNKRYSSNSYNNNVYSINSDNNLKRKNNSKKKMYKHKHWQSGHYNGSLNKPKSVTPCCKKNFILNSSLINLRKDLNNNPLSCAKTFSINYSKGSSNKATIMYRMLHNINDTTRRSNNQIVTCTGKNERSILLNKYKKTDLSSSFLYRSFRFYYSKRKKKKNCSLCSLSPEHMKKLFSKSIYKKKIVHQPTITSQLKNTSYYIHLLQNGEKEAQRIVDQAYKNKDILRKIMYKNVEEEIEKFKLKEKLIYEQNCKKMEQEIKNSEQAMQKEVKIIISETKNIFLKIDEIVNYIINKIVNVDLTLSCNLLKYYFPMKDLLNIYLSIEKDENEKRNMTKKDTIITDDQGNSSILHYNQYKGAYTIVKFGSFWTNIRHSK
ncbi:conserved Plasmodium protein, unknown function [Plasmodium malariae]|uniref:Uncharacterized protein n=1 Tax=Plasmodium malariae TaxID=5858 RepID=A0A1C3KZF0_PLAMA|nr:conserved Plasmodium protein, unknown function [Plasmodium malariae]